MSSAKESNAASKTASVPQTRRRLSREERYRQLVDAAWRIVREEGTDALTLGRLAERSSIAKPVVYDHFATRSALLAALFQEFDARQTAIMDATLHASEPTLTGKAAAIAASYVDCVLVQGREIPDVTAALAGSPELEKIKRGCQVMFMDKCRMALTPFAGAGTIAPAGLWAMLGAAEALSQAAATGEISETQAKNELSETIVAMVARTASGLRD